MINLGIVAALISMLVGTGSSLLQKKIAIPLGYKVSAFLTLLIAMIPIGIGILVFGAPALSQIDVILCLISGIFLAAGFLFRYYSLNTEQVTEVAALGQVQPAIITFFGLFVLSEQLTVVGIISIFLIFIGSALITVNKNMQINRRLIPSILGGTSWGIYWVLIALAVNSSGDVLMPLLISRVLAVVLLGLFIAPTSTASFSNIKKYASTHKKNMLYIIAAFVIFAGLGNGLGDSLFSVTAAYNVLALGAAISALSPMFVAFTAYFIFKDRLTQRQKVGFLFMLIGSLLISVL